MKKDSLTLISFNDFFALDKGDTVFIKVCDELLESKVLGKPFWNSDADDPDWEIETSNGFSDMYSLLVKADFSKSAPEGIELDSIIFKHENNTYEIWKGFALSEEDSQVLWNILSKYETEGSSFTGSREDVAEEFFGQSPIRLG